MAMAGALGIWGTACDPKDDDGGKSDVTFADTAGRTGEEVSAPDTAGGAEDTAGEEVSAPDTAGGAEDTAGEEVSAPDTAGGAEDTAGEPDVPAACGNGVCDNNEDPCTCAEDCGNEMSCCLDEDCPQPLCGPCCHAYCIEFECVDEWQAPCCWNGECEEGETPETCPEDCPPGCGDGICQADEDNCDCPEDCKESLECCADEDCPQPKCGPCCHAFCVENECVEKWDAPCCWNGECEDGETPESCPQDCPPDPQECDFWACNTNADCVKTNLGCCPCNSGGTSTAIASQCLDAWQKSLDCPPDLMCPMVYLCDDSVAVCEDNLCKLSGGGNFE